MMDNTVYFPFPTSPGEAGPGKLAGFFPVLPGAGATTLACMVALAMQKQNVAIVDLRRRGKVRSYMGITPDVSSGSVLDAAGIQKHAEIRRAGIMHPREVFVIPGVIRP
ncbi:MAG: hypothetical protein K6U74_04525, partial [Firmicutes bacterium]|nr:hypothetical protein [Bacillota bacterium]